MGKILKILILPPTPPQCTFPPMPHGRRIAELLLSIGAVKLSPDQPFTWTSGIKSPIYCDVRMIYSVPRARDEVVNGLASRVQNLHIPPDVVAGTALAAIGWGVLVAHKLNLPFVYVRSATKEHGMKKRIEGMLKPDQHVVVIEDLISTGGSSVATVDALRHEGKALVTDIVAIFSYEFLTAAENAQSHGVKYHPLSTVSTMLSVAVEMGEIAQGGMKTIADFVKNPEDWAKSQ